VSVKATVNGTFPEVGVAEKLAAGRTFPGAVKALMHIFVFESYEVMSVQVFPSELIKLSPAWAVALLL